MNLTRDRAVLSWVGVRAASEAGDALWTVALAWTAVQVASPAVAGLVVAAGTVPRALVLLLGGVVADRYETRRVMGVVGSVRVVLLVAAALWAALGTPSVALLLGAAVLLGVTDALFSPASSTVARQLVPPEELAAYAGLSQTATRLATMLGTGVGGVVVATGGLATSAGANAATMAVLVVFLALFLRPRFPIARAERESVLRSVAGGFAYLRDEPVARTLVVSLLGLNLAAAPALGIGLALRAADEGWGAQSVGLLQALVALGATAGTVAVLRRHPGSEARVAFALLVVQGLAIATLGLGPLWATATACAVVGLTAGVASPLLSGVFVATVRPELLGRTVAIQGLGDDVLMPVATAGFGALAVATSLGTSFAVYGLAMAALMLLPLSRRRLREVGLPAAAAPARTDDVEAAVVG